MLIASSRPLRWACLSLLAGAIVHAADAPGPTLKNPGFEDAWPAVVSTADTTNAQAKVTGEVASGWSDNSSWADVQVAYAADTTNPHRGKTAQRITVNRVSSGNIQYVQLTPFIKDRAYAFSIWMRGRPGSVVAVVLRKAGAPYTQYASIDAALSPEWKEFTVEGVVPEDVADGMVMLRMSAAMEVVVDDAKLTDITALASDAPPQVGNLVSGGSFEAGMPFGWSTRIEGRAHWEHLDPRPVIDAGSAVEGTHCYRIDVPSGDSACLQSPVIHPNLQRVHSASMWLKASKPETWVRVELEKTGIAQEFRVGPTWQKVAISGTVPFQRWTRLRIRTRSEDSGNDRQALTLWADDVQVEEGPTTSATYKPPMPYEMTMRLARPGSIVFDGEQAAIDLSFAPVPPTGARLRLQATDVFGKTTDLPAQALPAQSLTLPAMADRPRGVFKLTAVIEDAKGTALSAPVALVWSRLPRPRELDPTTSYFGIHMPLAADNVAVARATGTRWVRLHDASMITKWPVTETAKGQWEFYDQSVDAAHFGGLAVLGMLDGAPRWVSSKTREGYWGIWHLPDLPTAPAEWENYVRTMVTHYRGRIDAWEMWNEPWGEWWAGNGGTPELYAKLMEIAYRTTKQANPTATFIGVDTYRGRDSWHDGVLAAAKLGSFDAFSFHDYADSLYGGPESLARIETDTFNAAQAKYGTPKPLWNTEGGSMEVGSFYAPETGGMPVRRQLAQAVRYDVTMMGAGVKVFCVYAIHSDPAMGENECRVTEFDRAIKPYLAARAVLASLVDGGGMPVRSEPVPGIDLFTYPVRDGQRVSVAWSHDGDPHRLPVVAGAQTLDVMGNPLSVDKGGIAVDAEPIYLITPAP